MKRTLVLFAGAAVALGMAGPASAQLPWPFGPQPQQSYPYEQGRQTITFYEGPNYTGRQVTIYNEERDFSRIGFNDRARSARASGAWTICEHADFGGRCERINGSVPDLYQYGLSGRVSSARMDDAYGGGPYDDGYDRPGRGYGNMRRDGVEGRTAVFFIRPTLSNGQQVAARGQGSADQFCRAVGYGTAIYWSQGERSRQAVDQDGRIVDAPVLRDVLCRR